MAGNPYLWETTAANNDDADGDINFAEGQTPGSVNNSARGTMAGVAGWLKDTNGTITSGGSANGYTITSNIAYAALATGIVLGFKANHTNTGAATLTLNALTSKAIRIFTTAGDVAVPADSIMSGGQYMVRYDAAANSAAGAWILLNPTQLRTNINVLRRTVGTPVTLTNQTTVSFTSIPAGTVRIEVMLSAVSVSSTNNAEITLGDSGGPEATGYVGSYGIVANAAASVSGELSNGIPVAGFGSATLTSSGIIAFDLVDASNTWAFSGTVGLVGGTPSALFVGGTKQLSGELTTVNFGINGVDLFDAGIVNIAYYHP